MAEKGSVRAERHAGLTAAYGGDGVAEQGIGSALKGVRSPSPTKEGSEAS